MYDFDLTFFLLRLPIVLMALTFHEFAHAYVAYRMGDPTAYRLGRCTLNPVKHLDLLGTICLMFAPIGWAKPVPVNPMNFDDQARGDLYTSIAGPLSNIIQAILWALLLRGILFAVTRWGQLEESDQLFFFVTNFFVAAVLGVMINIGLAAFNMLPLFPLDGFHVTGRLVSPATREKLMEAARFGPFLILALVLISRSSNFDLLGKLIEPPTRLVLQYVAGVDPVDLFG